MIFWVWLRGHRLSFPQRWGKITTISLIMASQTAAHLATTGVIDYGATKAAALAT